MTPRGQALLGPMSPTAKIVEVGPGYNPAIPKSTGMNVWSIDHATRDELVSKYADHATVDASKIEEVDYVWRGGSLADAVPEAEHGTFDGFIASHVVEHTPDFLAFLGAAQVLLKPSGVVGLAVPDKRYCFDYFQPLTTTGRVIEAHLTARSRHSAGTVFDHFSYCVANGETIAWGQLPVGGLRLLYAPDFAWNVMAEAQRPDSGYIDAHNWRFTPASFRLVMLELAWLGLTNWKVEQITDTQGPEFIVRLRGGGAAWARAFWPDDLQAMRLTLLKTAMIEQRTQIEFLLAGEPRLTAWSGA